MTISKSVFINNEWQDGEGAVFEVFNPATLEVIAEFAEANNKQVDDAYNAARIAFTSWSKTTREARIAILENYAKALDKRRDEIAECISRDTGKTIWETKGEATSMIGKVAVSIRAYHERTGQFSKPTAFGSLELNHKPYGVMAVMGPFNFPGHLPNGHIAPALLAGNTIVFKPSELAPMVSLIMADALAEAGVPDGVVNIVNGGRETGAAVLASKELNGVLFTGSANTGTYIHKLFGGRPDIILALEMGGNNPLIAWDSLDIDAAADIILHSSFITSGQRCSCARRVILPDNDFARDVINAVVGKCNKMIIGKYDDNPQPFIGPLISPQMVQNVLKFQAHLLDAGGKSIIEAQTQAKGKAFVNPAIIDMTGTGFSGDDELFAPFVQLYRVKNFDEAIDLANKTKFGLSAGLISENPENWLKVVENVRAGIINHNRPTTGASGETPFGGPGLSGNGRPGAYYAADYCAYPIAGQCADKVLPINNAIGFV